MSFVIHHGDCLDVLRGMADNSVDSIVTDPPAGIGFMGKEYEPRGDTGSAARFFYCSKVSRSDRNEGLAGAEKKTINWSSGTQNPGSFQSEGTDKSAENHHPTVKSTELMRWLCRLITPPGGTVLDPFAGSGSTGKAAILEGFTPILIEREAEYLPIIRARCEHAEAEYFDATRQMGLAL